MSSAATCDEELVRRLPLPLAQLFRRAHNAKTPLEKHLTAFYLWEAALKLLASVAIIEYAERPEHDPQLAERLTTLARPSLGNWWEYVRRLIPILADQGDAPYQQIRDLVLGHTRDDMPRAAGLDAALRDALEGKSGARTTVRLTELFDRLVRYRNQELGHGAAGQRSSDFYEQMGRAILAGVAEVLGRLDVLAGRRLVYIAEVRQAAGVWLIQRYELIGENARRIETLERPRLEAAGLPDAERVFVDAPAGLRLLHPLLMFDAETEEVLYLNARRGRQRTEYLSYTTGRCVDRPDLGGEQRAFLARVLGMPVAQEQAAEWATRSQAEEALLAPSAESMTRQIGEFELGRGGMGKVYRAWQPSLGRQVALKELLRTDDAKSEARFAREVRALGRVDHPHLVKIFTSGSDGEHWFYAMELIDGAPLSAVCERLATAAPSADQLSTESWTQALSSACIESRNAEKPLSNTPAIHASTIPDSNSPATHHPPGTVRPATHHPPRATYVAHVAELVRQIAGAAHALHEGGVIHRDIKPGNIMVNTEGSQAVLMDLGLAQLADDMDGRLTRTRQFVGTLRNASPEQVLAVGRLDRRSDVYSLGATLWELLTLRPLCGATDATPTPELMQRIQYEEPARLRIHHPGISRDLEAVVFKCLEKDPKRRYATADDLAAELQRFLNREPVQARPVGAAERLWRWCRRNPVVAALEAGIAVALVLGTVVAWYLAARANQHATRADWEAEQAKANEKLAQDAKLLSDRRYYASEMKLASLEYEAAQLGLVQQRLKEHIPQGPQDQPCHGLTDIYGPVELCSCGVRLTLVR